MPHRSEQTNNGQHDPTMFLDYRSQFASSHHSAVELLEVEFLANKMRSGEGT